MPNWNDVSFGGWVADLGAGGYVGEWQVNLHNVSDDGLDKSKFHGTEVTSINFYDGNSSTCNDAVNFTVNGTFNGEDGYRMIFRAVLGVTVLSLVTRSTRVGCAIPIPSDSSL